jgi:hypothetical protein
MTLREIFNLLQLLPAFAEWIVRAAEKPPISLPNPRAIKDGEWQKHFIIHKVNAALAEAGTTPDWYVEQLHKLKRDELSALIADDRIRMQKALEEFETLMDRIIAADTVDKATVFAAITKAFLLGSCIEVNAVQGEERRRNFYRQNRSSAPVNDMLRDYFERHPKLLEAKVNEIQRYILSDPSASRDLVTVATEREGFRNHVSRLRGLLRSQGVKRQKPES